MKLKNKNKKGFTLVELLAVIVILSVVALIGMTTVLPRVEQARKDAFATDANKFIQAASTAYATLLIDGGSIAGTNANCKFEVGKDGCLSLQDLVDKGFITKSDVSNYQGAVCVKVSGSTVSYGIKMSNGKFYLGTSTAAQLVKSGNVNSKVVAGNTGAGNTCPTGTGITFN